MNTRTHVRRHLIAPLLLGLAGLLASCREPVGVVEAAPPPAPETAVRANGGLRSAVSALTVDAMTIETRYWNSSAWVAYANGYTTWTRTAPFGPAAVATFEALPRTTPGYTNAPVELPSLKCRVVIPGVTGTPPDYADGSLTEYQGCIRNPGDGTTASPVDIGMRYRMRVTASRATDFAVRFAVDFAGGVLLVDGQVVDQLWNDPYWNGFFETDNGDVGPDGVTYVPRIETDTSTVLFATFRMTANTTSIIEVVGFENGKDFGASAQFNDGGGWTDAVSMVPSYKVPLNVSIGTGGGGRVTSAPAGINCGAACSSNFAWATMPSLTAIPDQYFAFSGWSGACGGDAWCAPLVETPKSVTATFRRVQWPLQVTRAGPGQGTVTSADGVINCGTTCLAGFPVNAIVTLTAISGPNSVFAGWSGGGCTGTGSCTVSMNAVRSVTAMFDLQRFALSVVRAGTGTGTITSSPTGINCGVACEASYAFNTLVTLTASPNATSVFAGWSGACSGSGACTVPMTQARTVTATFTSRSTSDTAPPVISCKATPSVLWPVNHKMVDILVAVALTDAGSGPAGFRLLSVTSNEPANRLGDGATSVDMAGWALNTNDVAGQLRAERAGTLRDRIYTLTYRGADAAGNVADASCTVTVPHDQR